MTRLITATILITIVYSWEDLKRTLVWSMRAILRSPPLAGSRRHYYQMSEAEQKHKPYVSNTYDQIVGTALILASFPANLVYLLLGSGNLMVKLLLVLSELLLIGLLVEVLELFIQRINGGPQTDGIWVIVSSLLAGAAAPTYRLASQIISHKQLFTSYLKHLAFPILFGIGLKYLTDRYGSDVVAAHSDTLIGVAVASLVLMVVINLLEQLFRRQRLSLFTYFRVVLGIVLVAILGSSLR